MDGKELGDICHILLPVLPVYSIAQCKQNPHDGACLESLQSIGYFELTLIAAYKASNMIWKVKSLNSRIKTHSFFDDTLTSIQEGLKHLQSDMAVGIG
jgi:hypothetical protein